MWLSSSLEWGEHSGDSLSLSFLKDRDALLKRQNNAGNSSCASAAVTLKGIAMGKFIPVGMSGFTM